MAAPRVPARNTGNRDCVPLASALDGYHDAPHTSLAIRLPKAALQAGSPWTTASNRR
jgi:hypothetical protein